MYGAKKAYRPAVWGRGVGEEKSGFLLSHGGDNKRGGRDGYYRSLCDLYSLSLQRLVRKKIREIVSS